MALLCLCISRFAPAQSFVWSAATANDSVSVDRQIKLLAAEVMNVYTDSSRKNYLENVYRLQLLTGQYKQAVATAKVWLPLWEAASPYKPAVSLSYQLYAQAVMEQSKHPGNLTEIYTAFFHNAMAKLDDKTAYREYGGFFSAGGYEALKEQFQHQLAAVHEDGLLDHKEAVALCTSYADWKLFEQTEALAQSLILNDCKRRYTVSDQLVSIAGGIQIHVVVIGKKGMIRPVPAALQYTIYADSVPGIRLFAPPAYGYAGVMAYSRGKGLSPDNIVPFEHDGEDADQIITWIARQPWCNGKVGMYGGSYNGFTQWAAAKYHNPALKTIVPYVAAIPGLGLPMENNVFLNANYGWAFYTTNHRYLDNLVYNNPARWRSLNWNWFNSGVSYRKIDSIDGAPHPWLQRWLQHPDYDRYWQQQVPYQQDFAGIQIPVLTVEGYYDDGQISGLHYYLEHLKYNTNADHYLLIGPYDHFGTQTGGVPVLRGYEVDPVALISTREVTWQWLDYVLKGGPRPGILSNKVNYEVMGANKWEHAASLADMASKRLRLYLTDQQNGNDYLLAEHTPGAFSTVNDTIDLANRQSLYGDYYPSPIMKQQPDRSNGLFFLTKPFDEPVQINGRFSGELRAIINKKDMDITVVFYEVTPEGKYFQLSYFLGRASYAKDMTSRQLLHPGQEERIPFERTRLVSRQLRKGSRLLVVVNGDKNPFAEINYGTGGDVADETSNDGKTPLFIQWTNSSYIDVPVKL
ncbi:hydrolase, CocE/NonD family [Filimonas lacunae]|nr:hydrolase, CocE/NonD family [Filimonas lacunae]